MHAVLFDLDGTLTQTYYSEDRCFFRALQHLLPEVPENASWDDCPDLTDQAIFHHFFQQYRDRLPTDQETAMMKAQFLDQLEVKYANEPAFFEEIPGSKNLLAELANRSDVTIGIATGSWEELARFKLAKAGFPEVLPPLIGCNAHASKPGFLRALLEQLQERSQVPAFDSLTYVGDSLYDYRSARSLGMDFIGVDHRGKRFFDQVDHTRIVPHFDPPAAFYRWLPWI